MRGGDGEEMDFFGEKGCAQGELMNLFWEHDVLEAEIYGYTFGGEGCMLLG